MSGIGNNLSALIIIDYMSCEVFYILGPKWHFL